jgi:hypothetical protein
MFWKSITEGLLILGNWQVWVTAVVYMAVNFAFLMIVTKLAGEDESGGRMAAGCLFHMIGGTVLHGILMGLMISFLLPILLGAKSVAPLSAIISMLWPIMKVGLIAIIGVTVLCFIPLIGGPIANSPGIQAFMEGVIIFRLISGDMIDYVLNKANVQGSVYPGFWESIGFLVIAGVFVRAVMFGLALLSMPLEDTEVGALIPVVVGPVFGILGGIIPVLMYSSYTRLAIVQLIAK